MNDRGGGIGLYSGPSGPLVTLAKIARNVRRGAPPGKGLPSKRPFSDPDSP
jgi:hypothetical protein